MQICNNISSILMIFSKIILFAKRVLCRNVSAMSLVDTENKAGIILNMAVFYNNNTLFNKFSIRSYKSDIKVLM